MRAVAVAFSMLLVAAGSAVRAQDTAKDIIGQTETLAKALSSGDVNALKAITTADFQFTDIFGRVGPVGQWTDRFKTVLTMAKDPVVAPGTGAVITPGDAPVAILKIKVTGIGKDRLGEEGPLDMTLSVRTQWTKEGGAWKMKSAKEVQFEGTANKRPLSFSKTPADEDTRKGFRTLYGAVSELYEKRDFDKMEKGLPADFVIHDMEGKVLTAAEMFDRVRSGAKTVANPIMTIEPQQVALDGDKLYVIRVMRLIGDVSMPGGKVGRVVYNSIARDTYVKSGKDWKPKGSDELHAEATLDKLPIPLSLLNGK